MLGISWAMGAHDDGMKNAMVGALEGIGKINDMISEQGAKFKKIKPKQFFDKLDNGAKSAAKSVKAFTKDMSTDRLSDGILGFAIKADDALLNVEKRFSDTFGRITTTTDTFFAPFDKAIKNTKRLIGDLGDAFEMVIGKRLRKLTKPLVDFGKRGVAVAKKVGGAFKSVGDGLSNMKNSFNSGMDEIQKRVQQFNVASIAKSMRTLSGETGNLTNALEAEAVQNAKAAKPIIATMNLSAAEMKKLTSKASGMAVALNSDAASIAETLKAIETAGEPAKKALDAMGMSEKDWQKVVETTGIGMQDYVAMLGDMTASWGMSSEQAGDTMNNMVAMGKKVGVGTEALKGMKTQLDEVGSVFKDLPPNMARSADEIQSLMESGVRLSGVFKQMGKTEEEAVAAGNATAKMFAEQAVMVEKLYAVGGEGALDDSPMFKFLTQLGKSSEEARKILAVGSRDAVAGTQMISDVFNQLGGKDSPQVQYALNKLSNSLGDSAGGLEYLVQSMDVGRSALSQMSQVTVDGSNALKQYGKDAFSTGRTLQDTYDLAQQQFETQFRSIARKQVRGLAGEQIKAFKDAGKELKVLGSDKTWGPLIKSMSLFDQMGVGGLGLAFLDEKAGKGAVREAAKMGHEVKLIMDMVGKVGDEISPLMEMIGMLGPLGPLLAGGGIAALFLMDEKSQRDILGGFYDTFAKIKDQATAILKKIPWDDIMKGLKSAALTAWNWIKAKWKGLVDDGTVDEIKSKIGGAVTSAFDAAGNQIDWKGLGTKILDTLKKVVGGLWDAVGEEFGATGQLAIGGMALGTMMGKSMGGSMLSELANSKGGMVAMAGMAGIAIGTAMWDAWQRNEKKGAKDRRAKDQKTGAKIKESLGAGRREAVAGGPEAIAKAIQAGTFDVSQFAGPKVNVSKFGDLGFKEIQSTGGQYGGTQEVKITLKEIYSDMESKLGDSSGTFMAWDDLLTGLEHRAALLPELAKRMNDLQKMATQGGTNKAELSKVAEELRGISAQYLSQEGGDAYQKAMAELQQQKAMIEEAKKMASEQTFTQDEWMIDEQQSSFNAGYDIAKKTGEGYSAGVQDQVVPMMEISQEEISKLLGGSLPEAGPLQDGVVAYSGGYETMMSFAQGIVDSGEMVRAAVEQTLNDSVILTMETYAAKLQEVAEKKTMLASVAKAIVRDLGGDIQTTVDVAGETENVKAAFEAALAVPGLAGVTLAITQEGAKTRRILGKILMESEKQTGLMGGGTGGKPKVVNPELGG